MGWTAVALAFWPDLTCRLKHAFGDADDAVRDVFRSQMIRQLALGADGGQRMGPTEQVIPLTSAPERPQLELVATLAEGDTFANHAAPCRGFAATRSVRPIGAMPLNEIQAGTKMDITLGRRTAPARRARSDLDFPRRFDLALEIARAMAPIWR